MYPIITSIQIDDLGIPTFDGLDIVWTYGDSWLSAGVSKEILQNFVDELAKRGIEPSVSYKTEQTICFEIDKLPRWAPTIILDDLDDIDLDEI